MRKFISTLNLVVAVGMAVLMMLVLISAPGIRSSLQFVVGVMWILCAVRLRRSRELWPWVGCLILVSAVTLIWGAELLRIQGLIWQAGYGDRSIEIDPSTVGAPLFVSGLLTLCTLALLVTLFSLPAWQFRKEKDA